MGISERQTNGWLTIALIPIAISATLGAMHFIERSKRHIDIIIVPICNPGRSCQPSFPKQLRNDFFHHPRGVGPLISSLLREDVVVRGQVTPWIRASQKLKSPEEIVHEIPFILEQINTNLNIKDFQVILFTVDTPGSHQTIFWPTDQPLEIHKENIGQRIGIIINPSFSKNLSIDFPISPSKAWLKTTAAILGLTEAQYQLCL